MSGFITGLVIGSALSGGSPPANHGSSVYQVPANHEAVVCPSYEYRPDSDTCYYGEQVRSLNSFICSAMANRGLDCRQYFIANKFLVFSGTDATLVVDMSPVRR